MKHIKIFTTAAEQSSYDILPCISIVQNTSGSLIHKDPFNGNDYIDFGLPSGTLWATKNVGVTNIEDVGNIYAWGEIATKSSMYYEDDYLLSDKYNSTDEKTVLDLEDDIAHIVMGGEWKLPTKAQWEELYNNCTFTQSVTYQGVNCSTFSKTINGVTKTMYLPAPSSGGAKYGGLSLPGAMYWSSTLNTSSTDKAYLFQSTAVDTNFRYMGCMVRGALIR